MSRHDLQQALGSRSVSWLNQNKSERVPKVLPLRSQTRTVDGVTGGPTTSPFERWSYFSYISAKPTVVVMCSRVITTIKHTPGTGATPWTQTRLYNYSVMCYIMNHKAMQAAQLLRTTCTERRKLSVICLWDVGNLFGPLASGISRAFKWFKLEPAKVSGAGGFWATSYRI